VAPFGQTSINDRAIEATLKLIEDRVGFELVSQLESRFLFPGCHLFHGIVVCVGSSERRWRHRTFHVVFATQTLVLMFTTNLPVLKEILMQSSYAGVWEKYAA
jgi:hypothetical protein